MSTLTPFDFSVGGGDGDGDGDGDGGGDATPLPFAFVALSRGRTGKAPGVVKPIELVLLLGRSTIVLKTLEFASVCGGDMSRRWSCDVTRLRVSSMYDGESKVVV